MSIDSLFVSVDLINYINANVIVQVTELNASCMHKWKNP